MIMITGASSGLGRALAELYSKDKTSLFITGRNKKRLDSIANQLPTDTIATAADLTDPNQVSRLFENIDQPPERIVHCAGSGYFGPIEDQDPSEIEKLLSNNVSSTILLVQELVKRYRNQNVHLVVVMSTAAQVAKAGESTYCAAKWAVRGFIESVRLELKGSPMKLIAVYPGGMATDFWKTSGKDIDTSAFMSAEEAALMLKQALVTTEHGMVSDIVINRN